MGWDQHTATVEEAIDGFYGAAIRLMPYKEGGYSTPAQPDNTRPVVSGIGYLMSKNAAMTAPGGAFISKRLDADLLLRVQPKYLTSTQDHDRIMFTAGTRINQVYEVAFIEPSANGRPVLHLLKVKD